MQKCIFWIVSYIYKFEILRRRLRIFYDIAFQYYSIFINYFILDGSFRLVLVFLNYLLKIFCWCFVRFEKKNCYFISFNLIYLHIYVCRFGLVGSTHLLRIHELFAQTKMDLSSQLLKTRQSILYRCHILSGSFWSILKTFWRVYFVVVMGE